MRTRLFLAVLLAASALPAQVTFSQGDWKGVAMQFDARLEPAPRTVGGGMIGSVMTGRDRQHRIVTDGAQKRYFGYDFRVEPRDGSFQVRIEPLNLTPEDLREVKVDSSWGQLSLPNYPTIPAARVGDTIAIDVLVNPSTGHKVVDYISFIRSKPSEIGQPQDFTLEDAALEITAPKLRVNGSLVDASVEFGGSLVGPKVWFYLPGHGRFVVTLVPPPQLQYKKAGQVSGQTLTFTDLGVEYRIESNRRIAPGVGTYNIYVGRNAVWRPGNNEPFLWGSFD